MKPFAHTLVLDKHLDARAFKQMFPDCKIVPLPARRPRLRYVGRHPHDEDHFDVLQVTWEESGLLMTCDGAMPAKAREFGRCGSHDRYITGVVVLPKGKAEQKRILSALVQSRIRVSGISAEESALDIISDSNLGVDLRAKQPSAMQLCDCPYVEIQERLRKRYKRK